MAVPPMMVRSWITCFGTPFIPKMLMSAESRPSMELGILDEDELLGQTGGVGLGHVRDKIRGRWELLVALRASEVLALLVLVQHDLVRKRLVAEVAKGHDISQISFKPSHSLYKS